MGHRRRWYFRKQPECQGLRPDTIAKFHVDDRGFANRGDQASGVRVRRLEIRVRVESDGA